MTEADPRRALKPLVWVTSSRKEYDEFPDPVQNVVGFALYLAQTGMVHPHAKVLRGFGDAGVVEVVTAHDGDAYRTVYTVRFERAVFVLHAFKKKSKSGDAVPKMTAELIRRRLKAAKEQHEAMRA